MPGSMAFVWQRRFGWPSCSSRLSACRAVINLVPCAILAACTLGPDFLPPEAPAAERYGSGSTPEFLPIENGSQTLVAGTAPEARWWRGLGSPNLDAMIERALDRAPALEAAQATLRQAEEALRAGSGVFYPQVDLAASALRQRPSAYRVGPVAQPTQPFTLYTLTGSVGYVLDVFGAQRRAVEALGAQVRIEAEGLRGARLTLAANLANTVIAAAGYRTQIGLLEEQIELQRQQLELARSLEATGLLPHALVLNAQAALDAIRSALAPIRIRYRGASHLTAILQGDTPETAGSHGIDLSDFRQPSSLPLTLPSRLVRQRPDLRAAQSAVQVASARIGVATAALFPSFLLGASYGRSAPEFALPGTASGRFWSFGPSLDLPLFSGGAMLAQRRAAVEFHRGALAHWRSAVLAAFAQVADCLAALEHDGEVLTIQARQLRVAGQSLRLVAASRQAGLVSDIDLVAARIQYTQAALALAQAQTVRLQDVVALMVALGGEVENDPTPVPLARIGQAVP